MGVLVELATIGRMNGGLRRVGERNARYQTSRAAFGRVAPPLRPPGTGPIIALSTDGSGKTSTQEVYAQSELGDGRAHLWRLGS